MPGEMRSGKAATGDARLVTILGVVWIALLVVVYIVLAGWARAEDTRVTRLNRELEELKEASSEYFRLEVNVNELEAKQRSLNDVVGDPTMAVPIMAYLSRMVPANIQLTGLSLSNQRSIKLTGVVSSEPFLLDVNLSQFMIDIENSPHFRSVQLVSKGRSVMQGETVLDFELQCTTE